MKREKQVRWRALDSKVIVVAIEDEVNGWACYIGAVPGNNHEREWHLVAERGTKLPQKVAELLFPDFEKLRWRP